LLPIPQIVHGGERPEVRRDARLVAHLILQHPFRRPLFLGPRHSLERSDHVEALAIHDEIQHWQKIGQHFEERVVRFLQQIEQRVGPEHAVHEIVRQCEICVGQELRAHLKKQLQREAQSLVVRYDGEVGQFDLQFQRLGQKGDRPLVHERRLKRQLDQHPRLQ